MARPAARGRRRHLQPAARRVTRVRRADRPAALRSPRVRSARAGGSTRCRRWWRPRSGPRSSAAWPSGRELLDAVLADLYGAQRLLPRGLLPARADARATAATCGRPGARTPPTGPGSCSRPPTSAATPTGAGWRVADRTQAPSGLGYAMENRRVVSRVLPEPYREADLHRLTGFFDQLRAALADQAPPGPRGPPRRRAHPGHASARPPSTRPTSPRCSASRSSRAPTSSSATAGSGPASSATAGAGRRDPAPGRRRLVRPARAARRLPARRAGLLEAARRGSRA